MRTIAIWHLIFVKWYIDRWLVLLQPLDDAHKELEAGVKSVCNSPYF